LDCEVASSRRDREALVRARHRFGWASREGGIGRYDWAITAKEKLIRDVLDLDEARATRARIVVVEEPELESETVPLPEGWERMANGAPMPDVAAAVRRSREGH
jgi:hypothetical protein